MLLIAHGTARGICYNSRDMLLAVLDNWRIGCEAILGYLGVKRKNKRENILYRSSNINEFVATFKEELAVVFSGIEEIHAVGIVRSGKYKIFGFG